MVGVEVRCGKYAGGGVAVAVRDMAGRQMRVMGIQPEVEVN